MNNFKDFYKNLNQLGHTSNKNESSKNQEISTIIAIGIQGALSPIIGLSSGLTNMQEGEKFSKDVANYATSDEVISSLSEQIDKPKENETEQEFVERASNILRGILKKKVNI